MVIVEDTRQKAEKHRIKHNWWKENGDDLIRCKLPFGDYALPPKISIDTKASLTEIATNMCGSFREQRRVREECKLAEDSGCHLIFLIETGTTRELLFEKNIMLGNGKEIKGEQLIIAMDTMTSRYGCEFRFTKPSKSARLINEILNEYK